jgi:NAD+ synthase
MPCSSRRNYDRDARDARAVAEQYGIETRIVDLTPVKEAALKQLENVVEMIPTSEINIAPRLRMTTLYAIAACESLLVAGTGNRSEIYVGYFTKWGDGGHDFNPISDLTVTEVYEFLRYLDAPSSIIDKAPSAGLYESQTDESDMGFKYSELDAYLATGEAEPEIKERIERMHRRSQHKREDIKRFK